MMYTNLEKIYFNLLRIITEKWGDFLGSLAG